MINLTGSKDGNNWHFTGGIAMSLVTNIGSMPELDAYERAHPNGWAVGILTYVRILPLKDFQQVPGRTLVCCAPNGAPDSIEALAKVWLTHPRGKKADGSYRLYYFPEQPSEVVAALKRLGYWVYTVPGTARTWQQGAQCHIVIRLSRTRHGVHLRATAARLGAPLLRRNDRRYAPPRQRAFVAVRPN
jgi:hypothetical protein